MERLPFASRRIGLVAVNASFHYALDFRAALSEFDRVLAPGGRIVIIDTPFYERATDGERMVAERAAAFQRKYGMTEAIARSARYLTFTELQDLSVFCGLKRTVRNVWPGLKRKYQELRAGVLGGRIAQFPIVILERAS
jgi:ubiquinone/menaquinone biosynthesis C-methylase UbiE